MKYKSIQTQHILFVGLLLFHFVVLLLIIDNYSISSKELDAINDPANILSYITNISFLLFGHNDYALRIPFVVFYILSSILIYIVTKDYFKRQLDRMINVAIFMLLPGVNGAAILVNTSIVVVFCTILFIYLYQNCHKNLSYIFLASLLFVDNSFAILFLSLFFYALKQKNKILVSLSLILFGISMSMYGFDISGKPKGYFIDTFLFYATIFSPLLFLYFFYTLYRIGIKYQKDIFWYISITALGLSLLFSLRQKIQIEDFAPFVVIATPLMVKLFAHSLRVRLKEFRTLHYTLLNISIFLLLSNFVLLVFNKYLYLVLPNPTKHFARKHHIAKELAQQLHTKNINKITTYDKDLTKRLQFYGIKSGNDFYLTYHKTKETTDQVVLKFYDIPIAKYYIIDRRK